MRNINVSNLLECSLIKKMSVDTAMPTNIIFIGKQEGDNYIDVLTGEQYCDDYKMVKIGDLFIEYVKPFVVPEEYIEDSIVDETVLSRLLFNKLQQKRKLDTYSTICFGDSHRDPNGELAKLYNGMRFNAKILNFTKK